MSSYLIHRNKDIFPNPDTFDPSRWLDPVALRKLDRYLASFSKAQGSVWEWRRFSYLSIHFKFQKPKNQFILTKRGNSLAYSEVYITLGTIFRRYQTLKAILLSGKDQEWEDSLLLIILLGRKHFMLMWREALCN